MQPNWNTTKITHPPQDDAYTLKRNCPICNSSENRNILTIDNFQFFCDSNVNKEFSLYEVQCEDCGAVYLNPCFSDKGFEVLAGEAAMSYGSSEVRPNERFLWIQEHHHLDNNNHILDIGCGNGDFLKTLPNNLKKTGVDIDKISIENAQKLNKNIEFICSPFETFTLKERVDLITMFHVLEHLPNPLATLKKLHQVSDENTTLLIEVPIIENGATNDICGFLSALHLTHFSRNSLKNILKLSGWEIIEIYEHNEYNGCRVLAKKSFIDDKFITNNIDFSLPFRYLKSWYSAIDIIENKIEQIQPSKCVIWGGGMHLEFLYQRTSLFRGNHQFIIIDIDSQKQNKKWRGIDIYHPDILNHLMEDKTIIYIPSSYKGQNAIIKSLLHKGIDENSIIQLYDYVRIC